MAGRRYIFPLAACFLAIATHSSISQAPGFKPEDFRGKIRATESKTAARPRTQFSSYQSREPVALGGLTSISRSERQFPVGNSTPLLQQMARAAGTIFSGTVTSIAMMPASGWGSIGAVAVSFHVEHAIRGVKAGETLTIHEWSGLWSGEEHYRVGERVLLFLFPPSKLGLTSPVGGTMGRFAVDTTGRIVMKPYPAIPRDRVPARPRRINFDEFERAVRRAYEEE